MGKFNYAIFLLSILALIFSGIHPKDYFTWFLETVPCFVGLPLIFYFFKKGHVSRSLFLIVCIHSVILSVGGHYTYAEVPLGFWIQDLFDLSRNNFDRLGHIFQGITPTLICFQLIKNKNLIRSLKWSLFFSVSVALAFSALYELLEWLVAIISGESAEAFLGTQGDVWDTQWDMFLALSGAIFSAIFISIEHRSELKDKRD